jgi:hypothetical protein
MSSNIDVSSIVATINGSLAKFMGKFFEEFHEYRNDVPVEELKTVWERYSGVEIKEEIKKPKMKITKPQPEEAKKCIAEITSGKRAHKICGAKVSKNSKSGLYCNRHIKKEEIGEKKEESPIEEEEPQQEEKEPQQEEIVGGITTSEKKEPQEDVEITAQNMGCVGINTLSSEDNLKKVIKTVLDIRRTETPPPPPPPPPPPSPRVATPPVKKLKAKLNRYGHYVIEDYGFVIEAGKEIKGKEDEKGNVIPLSPEDIEICKKKKWGYKSP